MLRKYEYVCIRIIIIRISSRGMKLSICLMKNENLLQKFPRDPDYDVVIICGDLKFKLQIAFLYLESKYFDEMDQQGIKEIDLNNLDQEALTKVLTLLYGGEIVIKSFDDLSKIYTSITFLKIQSIKEIIVEQLKQLLEKLNSIQFLEFSYRHNVLVNQISTLNLSNDLQLLKDPKHSMQLNKISQRSLNIILLDYYHKCRNSENQEMIKSNINGILSDYFHTNKLTPQEYFQNYNVELLQYIWYEFHPVYYPASMYDSNNSNKSQYNKTIEALEQKVKDLKLVASQREGRIKELMSDNDRINQGLRNQKKAMPVKPKTTSENYLTIPKSPINKPCSIPISPTSNFNSNTLSNREDYYITEDDQYHSNKQTNINQMKSRHGINRIHTRNQSRGKQ